MIPAAIVFAYLAVVLYIGVFAFRRGKDSGEDFFLAGRALGPVVFLLSLFGTNMTAFTILGSSGMAYLRGIGVYGMMASSSALVIPLTFVWIGTRLWALGRRFGHMTQVQFLRDRWECDGIGTFVFGLTAAMLVPYIVIAVMGGGATLEAVSGGAIRFELGGAIVALVVMGYVFFGGMRGTAWVNTFQAALFLCFGAAAFILIGRSLGGFDQIMARLGADPRTAPLLTRARIPPAEFLSYMLIPLSTIMFPHISIFCLTAKKVGHFKATAILYPLCITAIWLPSVYLGVVAASQFSDVGPGQADGVMIRLLTQQTGPLLAGVLGAGIMACVMASDSQIMALSTMFTRDIFVHYGGRERFGERAQVWTGRAFVVGIAAAAYGIAVALRNRANIFEIAVAFAFSGFAALAPIMVAGLYWRRSTKWGVLAASVWVLAALAATWILYAWTSPPPGPFRPYPIFPELGEALVRQARSITVFGFLPVVPMVLGSVLLLIGVSLVTRPPREETLAKYFP
jgi:SSS family solute:Na+ symporter